jgi:hypothetical protein
MFPDIVQMYLLSTGTLRRDKRLLYNRLIVAFGTPFNLFAQGQ